MSYASLGLNRNVVNLHRQLYRSYTTYWTYRTYRPMVIQISTRYPLHSHRLQRPQLAIDGLCDAIAISHHVGELVEIE